MKDDDPSAPPPGGPALSARQSLAQAIGDRQTAAVALIQALGAGFGASDRPRPTRLHVLGRWAGRLAPAALLSLAAFVLWRELGRLDPGDVGEAMAAWGPVRIAAAVGLTATSYSLLAMIEWLGLRWAGASVPFRTAMLGAFSANAFAHTLGFGLLVGGAVRARLYARSGATLSAIARTTVFGSTTFGLGILLLAGLALLRRPNFPILGVGLRPDLGLGAGVLLVALPGVYLAACAGFRRPVRIGRQTLHLPSAPVAGAQVMLGLADNAVCGAIVWILLGPGSDPYSVVAGSYAIGTVAGALSNVPGGAGVFEGALLTLMPDVARPRLAAAFLGNRLIYYVLPLFLAAVVLAPRVVGRTSWAALAKSWRPAGPWGAALAAFALGASLILTGVGRIASGRLAVLRETVPAVVLDTTHLLSLFSGLALMGVSLLLLRRRADPACGRHLRRQRGLMIALLCVLALSRPARGADGGDPTAVPAGDYVLDPGQASLVLKLPGFIGLARPTLRLRQVEGSFRYDPGAWQATRVTLQADPRAMDASDTVIGRAAAKLIEPDRYPTIVFRSTSLTPTKAGRAKLAGTLLFHGVTQPLVLDVDFDGVAASGAGVQVRFSGRGRISRSAFGITAGRPFVGDTVDLIFDLDFIRRGR